MNIKIIICLILFCTFCQIGLAQQVYEPCEHYWEIPAQEQDQKKGVYLQYNESDSTDNPSILLINNTPDSLFTSGFYLRPIANVQFNINGRWKGPYLYDGCATGYGQFFLPKYTFTPTDKFDLSYFNGDYKTEVRFYIHTKDSVIISKSITLAIDTLLITSREEAGLSRINQQLDNSSALSTKERRSALLFTTGLLKSLNRDEEAIHTFEVLISDYPKYYEGIFSYAQFLFNQAIKREKNEPVNKKVLLQKALNEFEKIPRYNEFYKRAARYIEAIAKALENS